MPLSSPTSAAHAHAEVPLAEGSLHACRPHVDSIYTCVVYHFLHCYQVHAALYVYTSHVRIMYILQVHDRFTSAYQESIRTLKDYSVDPADTVIGVWAESEIVFRSVVHNTL